MKGKSNELWLDVKRRLNLGMWWVVSGNPSKINVFKLKPEG